MAVLLPSSGAHTSARARRFHPMRMLWLLSMLLALVLLGSFAYGMLSGVHEQQRLNQVWRGEIGTRLPAPKSVDPALKHPVNGVDFAIRIPRLGYFAAGEEGVDAGCLDFSS